MITAALVILFAVLIIVRERIAEIGLLKAIGASNWQVISQFGVEVIGLSERLSRHRGDSSGDFRQSPCRRIRRSTTAASTATTGRGGFGGSGGPGSGGPPGGGAGLFNSGFAQQAVKQSPLSAGLTPASLLIICGCGIALALLATIIPAWYVSRIKPAQVLRSE